MLDIEESVLIPQVYRPYPWEWHSIQRNPCWKKRGLPPDNTSDNFAALEQKMRRTHFGDYCCEVVGAFHGPTLPSRRLPSLLPLHLLLSFLLSSPIPSCYFSHLLPTVCNHIPQFRRSLKVTNWVNKLVYVFGQATSGCHRQLITS